MNSRTVVTALILAAFLLGVAGGAWYMLQERTPAFCEIGGRPIHGNMHTLVKVDGKRYHACCAQCALTLASQTDREIEILEVTDYVSGRPLPAGQAYYVQGSRVEVCSAPRLDREAGMTPYTRLFDRCAPSLLAFAQADEARAFIAEHGGQLKRLNQLEREAAARPAPAGERHHD